jgi:hypothetical protein
MSSQRSPADSRGQCFRLWWRQIPRSSKTCRYRSGIGVCGYLHERAGHHSGRKTTVLRPLEREPVCIQQVICPGQIHIGVAPNGGQPGRCLRCNRQGHWAHYVFFFMAQKVAVPDKFPAEVDLGCRQGPQVPGGILSVQLFFAGHEGSILDEGVAVLVCR